MRKVSLVLLIYSILFLLMLMPMSLAPDEDVLDVHVYIVCLDGVSASGVDNVSRIVEGVLKASNISKISYLIKWKQTGLYSEPVLGEVYVDVHVSNVTDWSDYKSLVESGANVLIVNSHGEILPVPADCTKEEWIDKIAYAVAYRNMTWAHLARYPFKDTFHQENGEETWSEENFKRFMSHIGKPNVTCRAPVDEHGDSLKDERCSITGAANFALRTVWPNFPMSMKMGNPISRSDIQDVLALPLYSRSCHGENYYSGAVIAFRKREAKRDFGFYIHLGGGQTYGSHQSSRDFDAGYVAGAAAIWVYTIKTKSLNVIHEAETAITEAEAEGRVKGLDEAKKLLQKAEDVYLSYSYTGPEGAISLADKAMEAANKAVEPSLIEAYILPITALSALGAVAIGSLVIKRRNNRRKTPRAEEGWEG